MTSQRPAFFRNAERVRALIAAAKQFKGTPFVANACIMGQGVSCQKLAGRLLVMAGHLPEELPIPDGPMDWGKANTHSLIAEWVDDVHRPDGSHYFRQVDLSERGLVPAMGDLLGFRIGGCVQHIGVTIELNPTFFMSALEDGAQMRRLDDATWFTRLERIWRPIE